jgi:hypothetical protein
MDTSQERVNLDSYFTVAEVMQLIRSLEWALMMDNHDDLPPDFPQRLDVMAHREFLQNALDKLRKSVKYQRQL